MKRVVVSAPGKVILMGEHAVVYGKPALIGAINKRLTVSVASHKTREIVAPEGKAYIQHILKNVFAHFHVVDMPVKIEVSSDIPHSP